MEQYLRDTHEPERADWDTQELKLGLGICAMTRPFQVGHLRLYGPTRPSNYPSKRLCHCIGCPWMGKMMGIQTVDGLSSELPIQAQP